MPSAIPILYAELSPAAQVVAEAIGAVSPFELSATNIIALLNHARVRIAGRRATARLIRPAVEELLDAGIVTSRPYKRVLTAPPWALPLTRLAHAHNNLESIIAALGQVDTHDFGQVLSTELLLRCNVVAGNFSAVDELVDPHDYDPETWRFLAEPVARDILSKLPAGHIDNALRACLDHVIENAAAPEAAIDACIELSPRPHVHAADIAFIRTLQGRLESAEAVFAALPPSSLDSKPARTGLAATRAWIATLRGDDASARRYLDEAIAAEKAGTRKRTVFPDSRAFALSLLALVRTDSPESLDLLRQLLSAADRLAIDREAELNLVVQGARLQVGQRLYANESQVARFEALLVGIAHCWADEFNFYGIWDWHSALLRYRAQAIANGLRWVAAECDEVLRHCDAHRDVLGANVLPDDIGDRHTHAALGVATLAVLAPDAPSWDPWVKALEQLAYDTHQQAQRKRTAHPAERRLVWEIVDENGVVSPRPREQRKTKSGRWSKGRRVAHKRLTAEAANHDFLTAQDRAALAATTVKRYWGGYEDHTLGEAALYKLAGHPLLVNSAGESVEIVRREPELSVGEDRANGLLVRIDPHRDEGNGDYAVATVNHRRYEVTRFTANHHRLFTIIPPDGLKLPADARPRVLDAVSALASEVRVQSDTADGAATATPVHADAEPWVRLEPLGAGLAAALVVEPIADSDLCFAPGVGGTTLFANRNGENVQTTRDLAAERHAASRLAAQCGQLASLPTENEPLALPDPQQCLELLEQLNTAGARCKWPQGEPLRIVAQATPSSLGLAIKSADEWMQASGRLEVDQQRVLDLKRLFALLDANPGSRFLELDSGEFLALTRTFRRQLDDLASLSTPTAKGEMRLHPLATLALDALMDDTEVDVDQGWRALRAKVRAAESFEPQLPSTLQADLRPYQLEGFRWLARLSRWGAGACLADDMGLGKTVQTLALLLSRAAKGPALVVAPTSVVANWIDEAHRFAPTFNVRAYVGTAAARARLLADPQPFDLFVTTYGVLQNDVAALKAVAWHSAVLDEAQAIKNPTAKRARAARQIEADFRLATTGTPIQNNLMDLHSLFSFINPGLLGTAEQFRRNFGIAIERDDDAEAQARLRRMIAPFVLRRLKTDVLFDLPERTEITLHVEMSPAEASLYEALRQRAIEELEAARAAAPELGEGARRVQVLAHLTRLRLACCNARLVPNAGSTPKSSKLATFATTLAELLESRHKVLVFSQFVKHLRLVEEHLKKTGVAYQYLDGGTPAKVRAERIKAFQGGDGDVFLISLKAGGTGLNLTAADYVIHMDPWWNPAVEDQASDRAHRIGQTRPVTIYRLVTTGTIEEQIVDLHHHKRHLAEQLLQGADATGRLNAEDLLELLRQPLGGGR